MAITVHFITRELDQLVLNSELGALRYLRGSHSGQNMAQAFIDTVEKLEVIDRVSIFSARMFGTQRS